MYSRQIGMRSFLIRDGPTPGNAMAKPQYGAEHKKARALAIATMVDGTPCPWCGRPMYKRQAKQLALGHVYPVAIYGPNNMGYRLEHRRCSNASGGRLAAKRNAQRKAAGTKGIAPRIGGSRNPSVPNHPARRRLPKW